MNFYDSFHLKHPKSKFDQYLQCFGYRMKNTILNKGLVATYGGFDSLKNVSQLSVIDKFVTRLKSRINKLKRKMQISQYFCF